MKRRVVEILIWRLMAVTIHVVACYALYLLLTTSLRMNYGMYRLFAESGLLITAISFNFALNLWPLTASRYRLSMFIGLLSVCLSVVMHKDIALSITLVVSGVLPMLSALTTAIVLHPRVFIINKRFIKFLLTLLISVLAVTLTFTFYKPTLPVFIGKEAVLPSGDIVKAEDVLKAYVDLGGKSVLVTDYGGVPVKSVQQLGGEVILDTQRGIISIAYQVFETLKAVGKTIKSMGLEIDVKDVDVSTFEVALAKVYPYIRFITNFVSQTLMHILRLIYGVLLIVVAMVVKR